MRRLLKNEKGSEFALFWKFVWFESLFEGYRMEDIHILYFLEVIQPFPNFHFSRQNKSVYENVFD